MICGIMQPYFFPYFGYFEHIWRCDKWVVFDLTQYTPKSYMTRNSILHPVAGSQYIKIDVKKTHREDKISSVRLLSPGESEKRILNQIRHYKKRAPYYEQVVNLIQNGMESAKSDSLVDMNISVLTAVCEYLTIPFKPIIASKADYQLPPITHPGQWALEIARLENADIYLNPPGGKPIFIPREFSDYNIKLGFAPSPDFIYATPGYIFERKLSIIDVLMWNSPETARAQFGKLEVEWAN